MEITLYVYDASTKKIETVYEATQDVLDGVIEDLKKIPEVGYSYHTDGIIF